MLRRKLMAFVIVFFILLSAPGVFAAGSGERQVRVFFDGEEIAFRVPPQIYKNRLVVPVRPFLEALGAKISWEQEKGAVTATLKGQTFVVYVNQSLIEVDGSIVEADVPAVIVGSTTMLPLRSISEMFGLKVKWDGEKGVAEVISENFVPFQRIQEDELTALPKFVGEWIELYRPQRVNRTMELEDSFYILSSLGWKTTGGYEVKIRKIMWDDNSWRVNIETREPLPGQPTIQVLSNPYDLVKVDLSSAGRPSAIIFDTISAAANP